VTARGKSFHLRDFLAVEVLAVPEKGPSRVVSGTRFYLRLNGKKALISTQSAGLVAGTLKWEGWQNRPRVVAGAGAGDGTVVAGAPEPTARFPGDPYPGGRRPGAPVPRAPDVADRSGIEREEGMTVDKAVEEAALPEGTGSQTVRGYLYFPYRDKLKKIKKVELVYVEGGAERAVVLPPPVE
jgi:hypothetical protein